MLGCNWQGQNGRTVPTWQTLDRCRCPDPSGYTSTNVQVADFNGDNKLDIVASITSSTKPCELEVLLNSSNPKTPTVSVASSLNPSTYGDTATFIATVRPKPLSDFYLARAACTKLKSSSNPDSVEDDSCHSLSSTLRRVMARLHVSDTD